MANLIKWVLSLIETGESNEVIKAKLEMLLCMVRTVPSYTVEDVVQNMIEEANKDAE